LSAEQPSFDTVQCNVKHQNSNFALKNYRDFPDDDDDDDNDNDDNNNDDDDNDDDDDDDDLSGVFQSITVSLYTLCGIESPGFCTEVSPAVTWCVQ